jgi:hypothetical protein
LSRQRLALCNRYFAVAFGLRYDGIAGGISRLLIGARLGLRYILTRGRIGLGQSLSGLRIFLGSLVGGLGHILLHLRRRFGPVTAGQAE